jgi:hypothetical protein
MPPVVRERVVTMERMLEGQRPMPTAARGGQDAVAEVGSLDVKPVELR